MCLIACVVGCLIVACLVARLSVPLVPCLFACPHRPITSITIIMIPSFTITSINLDINADTQAHGSRFAHEQA